MTSPSEIQFHETDLADLGGLTGKIAVFVDNEGRINPAAKRMNSLTKGSIARLIASEVFTKLKPGEGHALSFPAGLAAQGVLVVKLDRRSDVKTARKAGGAIAKWRAQDDVTVLAGSNARATDIA